MQNARLIQQLQRLTPGEIRRFVTFVESPFFNQNQRLLRLTQYLHRSYPDFPASLLEKETLFRVVFGEQQPFEEQPVHDQLSQLLRLLEQFLAQLDYEQDHQAYERHLLRALVYRNAQDHFRRIQRKALQRAEKLHLHTARQHLHLFEMGLITDGVAGRSQTREIKSELATTVRHLDAFYLSSRLRLSCELVNRRNVINADDQSVMSGGFQTFLREEAAEYLTLPAVSIYYQIYLSLTEPQEESHYQQLADLLLRYAPDFPRSEAYQMYAYAQNYCIRRINEGKARYFDELFQLYEQLLDTEILLDNGILAHEHYKNITTVALRLKKYEWVKAFLQKFRPKLHPDYQENAYSYNLAAYYYEQERYREAMKLLNQVEFTDVFYHLSAKVLLLKIYYEVKDSDALRYHIQAFRAFLKRNKQLPRNYIQVHINLLRLIKKAHQIWKRREHLEPEELSERVATLQQEIRETKGISNAAWLKAKVAELDSA